jgi:hypothetical protein
MLKRINYLHMQRRVTRKRNNNNNIGVACSSGMGEERAVGKIEPLAPWKGYD